MNGDRVSLDWIHHCWPLPHVTGFPCLGVLSASPTPGEASSHPCFKGLFDSTAHADFTGPPAFTQNHLATCCRSRTPEAPAMPRRNDIANSAFPFERQGRPPQDRSISGLLLSLALRPATSLFTLQDSCSRSPTSGRSACPAKLGSRLLARLYRGDHSRSLGLVRLAAHRSQNRA